MANFNIDELTLDYIGTPVTPHLYKLTVICNPNGGNLTTGNANIAGDSIILDPKLAAASDKVVFIKDIDFTKFENRVDPTCIDFELYIQDNLADGLLRKKGGVVVIDTKYPPPSTLKDCTNAHELFTRNFKINQIKCTRVTGQLFDMSIQTSTLKNYRVTSTSIKQDTLRGASVINALLCEVEFVNSSPTNQLFTFLKEHLNLHDNGMPIIIKSVDTLYDECINYKKGSIVILD
jgi:hypothetical protein